jgi:hypothetical protein
MSFLCLLSAAMQQNSEVYREIRYVVFTYESISLLKKGVGAGHGLINYKDTETKCRLY